jgi:GT2 family glycosyltransferase
MSVRRGASNNFPCQPDIPFDLSIVTYNSSKWLDNYFRSLIASGYPLAKIYVHVLDNGSNDDTLDRLRGIQSTMQGIFASFEINYGENIGFGAGHDTNFQRCNQDFVLISNVDIEFTYESLSKLLAHASADIDARFAAWEMCQAPYEHPKHYDPVSWVTNWQAYACVLVRRTAYKQVGGFDKKIFMYCEDVELSYRFRSFGWHLMYCPDCVVLHHSYETDDNLFKPFQFFYGTLGAGYVRMRYGTARDRLAAFLLHCWLILRREHPIMNSRRMLIANFARLLRDTPHFLRGKGKAIAAFPFRGFDFEIARSGANLARFATGQANILISVITRTYLSHDRDVLLRQAGMSIGNQRYKNIEWIVVQDGGAELQLVVNEIEQLYPHLTIKFIANDKLGRSHAGNAGLSAASGEYCMFLDDDDLLYADHCELLVDCLMRDSTITAAYSLSFEIPTDIIDGQLVENDYISHPTHDQEWDYEILQCYNFIPIQAILFNRRLFLERGGFNVALDQLEDWNLWLRYGYKNNFRFVRKTTSLYRVPTNGEKKAARQQLLDAAYNVAKADAYESIKSHFGGD